jgi:O-antigen/teichoic acid export membrane protein
MTGAPARRPATAGSSPSKDAGFRPVLSLMSGRALAFVATFFIPIVLARIFDQAEFGTYKQAFLIYATLYYIAQFGMAESLFYFLPLAHREGGRYAANSLLILVVAGLTGLALLGTTGAQISQWLNNGALAPLIPSVALYLLLTMAASILEIVLMARKRYVWAAWAYGASDVLRAVCFIVPAVATGRLEWLFLGAVAFAALRVGTTLLYLRREFGSDLRLDRRLLGRQLAYAGPFGLAVLVEIVQANLHQYAVSYHFDAATFAIYAVGCVQPPLLDFVATPTGNVMMVRMREAFSEGRPDAAMAVWHRTCQQLALLLFPLAGLQVVAAREIIVTLFTTSYLASVPIFMIWSTAIVLSAVLTDGVLRVHADTRCLLLLNVIRLLLVAGLITAFLAAFNLPGAALVTILATAVTKGLALARMKTLLRVGVSELLPWRTLGATLAAASAACVPALLLKSQLTAGPLPVLVATAAVYGGTYCALVWTLGVLTPGERQAITGWLQWAAPAAVRAEAGKGS